MYTYIAQRFSQVFLHEKGEKHNFNERTNKYALQINETIDDIIAK